MTRICPVCGGSADEMTSTIPRVPHYRCTRCRAWLVSSGFGLAECFAPTAHIAEAQAAMLEELIARRQTFTWAQWARMR